MWDPTNAYNAQHKYVLTSLVEVKSILLINEVSNSEDLILHLFSSVFDGVSGASKSSSGEQVSKDVEFNMCEILVTLIDEGTTLPPAVIDVIMAQFLRAAPPGGSRERPEDNQTTLLPKEEPEAYSMAKTICNHTPEKMSRYASQYFSDVIMDITGKGVGNAHAHKNGDDSDDEDHQAGPSEADFRELRKAHQLLRELWRAAPTVLPNVVPQVDAELGADNVQLRLLATETLGDMISGIGAAGPPPAPTLDPAAYPPIKLADDTPDHPNSSILTTPIAPLSFAQTHHQAFQNFASRRNDKSPLIRAAWTTAAGHIVATSAGGIGLSREDQATFVTGLREKLNDTDEKVRLAAVKSIETFSFRDIVTKLASSGGVGKEGSVLYALADRCRDRRPAVRVEAMALLGKLWAVASGELAAGQETVTTALAGIPSRLYNTFYANDPELNVLLERVIYECLLPLAFPPPKAKANSKSANANSQPQSQALADPAYDPDRVRAERVLLLARDLDANAKRAFNALQARQPQFSKVMETFVRQCEANNGGNCQDTAKKNLTKTIDYIQQFLPDAVKVKADLYNFALWHDRRSYQLIKFAVSAESDYKTMHRAVKELIKRIQGSPKPHVLDTMLPLLYRSAYIMYNKSHLSAFMDCSKSDKDGLGAAAHEATNEISQHNPDLFKTHIGQLCKDLVDSAPTASKENDAGMVETLKACSSYSRKYPEELPADRKFTQALTSYALYGQPPKAAKYAVNVQVARKDDKSMVAATDLLQKAMKNWGVDSPHFLNKMAAVCQLELLAPTVTADANDEIVDMAIKEVLQKVRTEAKDSDPDWVSDSELDEEIQLKCWALKLVVNRVRGVEDADEAKAMAPHIFKLLRKLLKNDGELCDDKETPKHHKSRLRLLAGQLFLKLCTIKHVEELFSHSDFNSLAFLAQDVTAMVRRRFVEKLQKYLVQNKLRPRFYTIIFLTAFEPEADLKHQIETWIRSRARHFASVKQNVLEATMARLLSLLAHHPDYSPDPDDLKTHAHYLLYYINTVTTEANFGMIFKYAERVKQTRDGIKPEASEHLYVLSDLATTILRKWQERKNWTFQVFTGSVGLPKGLYTALPNHSTAQEIAEKQFLPEAVDEALDDLLKSVDKKKVRRHTDRADMPTAIVLRIDILALQKRKSMDDRGDGQTQKRVKIARPKGASKTKIKMTPKAAAKKRAAKAKASRAKRFDASSSPGLDSADRRRSGRSRGDTSYMERDSSEDEDDMLEGVAEWQYYDSDGKLIDEDSDEEGDEDKSDEEGPAEDAMDEDDEEEPASKGKKKDSKKSKVADESEEEEVGEQEEEEAEEEVAEEEEEEEKEDEQEEEEEEAPPARPSRGGRRAAAAPPASKAKTLPSRPAAKAKATKEKPAATKAKPAKPQPAPSAPTRASRRTRGNPDASD